MNETLEYQVNGYILTFLNKMYPDGLTIKFIEALLYDWGVFITEQELLKQNIKYLLSKGYIEGKDIDLPAPLHKVKKVRLTEKGKALLNGEMIDPKVRIEE
ncbi:hypothetical protein [Persephonella sp.]